MLKEENDEIRELIDGEISVSEILIRTEALEKIRKELEEDCIESNFLSDRILYQTISFLSTYMQKYEKMPKSIQEIMIMFAEITKPLVDSIIKLNNKTKSYLCEDDEDEDDDDEDEDELRKAKANPDSLENWCEYSKKLEMYYWTFPFEMKNEELKDILPNVNSEKEFDRFMLKYFSKDKILRLEKAISETLPCKHKGMFKQIMNSFYTKSYAIANLGITAILDDLCTYFLEDKGRCSRKNLFLPIIEKVEKTTIDIFEVIPLLIINANINVLYENIDFGKRISILTNKTARRNLGQHGKKFSNKRIDTLMLLNTMYYMLVVIKKFSKYKNKVIYVKNQKEFKRADFQREYNKDRKFYIKKTYYRKNKK